MLVVHHHDHLVTTFELSHILTNTSTTYFYFLSEINIFNKLLHFARHIRLFAESAVKHQPTVLDVVPTVLDVVPTVLDVVLRRVFYFDLYEILVDSMLATHGIGEHAEMFSCLQFASSARNVASEVMETLYFCTN